MDAYIADPIEWVNDRRRLCDLLPWERNPRFIKDAQAKRLEESLHDFGQIHPIAIGPNNEILDGHQRKLVWSAADEYGPEYEVDVRVASRPLSEKERERRLGLRHAGG